MKVYTTATERGIRDLAGRQYDFSLKRPSTFVNIQNVADWYHKVNTHAWDIDQDFPYLRCPWTDAWFEYRLPSAHIRDGKKAEIKNPPYVAVHWVEHYGTFNCNGVEFFFPESFDGTTTITATVYLLANGPVAHTGDLTMTFNQDQEIIPRESGARFEVGMVPPPEGNTEDWGNWVITAVKVALLAITFCHCKNVTTRDHAPPPKVARKRQKAGKHPGVKYKTLVIEGMADILRSEGQVEKNGIKKALHVCRGHFATYTEEAPLFGRVTGTFWKPMHVRGSKAAGEVRKDYVVKRGNEA